SSVAANAAASAGEGTTFTPPALPRPPAWICAFTTTVPPSSRAPPAASSGVRATPPCRTGTPYLRRISFAWNSWMFIVSVPEEVAEELRGRLPAHVPDRARQRDLLGTDQYAVLGVAAIRDA